MSQLEVSTSSAVAPSSTTLVLDIEGGNLTPGTQVIVWTTNSPPSPNQLWTFTGDGYIQCQGNSNLVLDIKGGNLVPGTPVIVWTKNSPPSKNQLWELSDDGHIQSQGNTNLVLDITGGKLTAGTPIEVWSTNSPASPNQLWTVGSDGHIQSQAAPRENTSMTTSTHGAQLVTQLQGFDTVVAVSQKALNTQLYAVFKLDLDNQLIIELPDGFGSLTAKLGAPTIRVNTGAFPPEVHKVIFTLPFTGGVLQTWQGFGPSAKPLNLTFGAGDIAFHVNLDLADADMKNLPHQVQTAIANLKNLGPDMFSVQQLIMDLQNANLAEYDQSLTTLPQELVTAVGFQTCLSQYFASLHQAGSNVLGYSISVNNPNVTNPDAPTFPPTDMNFSTHVYSNTADANASKLDALEYLVMTQKHPLPTNALPSGDFVVSLDTDGTMAIARSVFVDSYLLPKIASATNLDINLTQNGTSITIITNPTSHPPFTATANGWVYTVSRDMAIKPDQGAFDPQAYDYYYKVDHSCNVSIPPGGNSIQVSGTTSIYSSVTIWWGIRDHALNSFFWKQATSNWSATITLTTSGTGDQLTGTMTTNIGPMDTTTGGNDLAKFDQEFLNAFGKQLDVFGTQLEDLLENALNPAQIESALETAFSNQRNYFVFPGADTFFFKDPFFNNELDLLVSIKYNIS